MHREKVQAKVQIERGRRGERDVENEETYRQSQIGGEGRERAGEDPVGDVLYCSQVLRSPPRYPLPLIERFLSFCGYTKTLGTCVCSTKSYTTLCSSLQSLGDERDEDNVAQPSCGLQVRGQETIRTASTPLTFIESTLGSVPAVRLCKRHSVKMTDEHRERLSEHRIPSQFRVQVKSLSTQKTAYECTVQFLGANIKLKCIGCDIVPSVQVFYRKLYTMLESEDGLAREESPALVLFPRPYHSCMHLKRHVWVWTTEQRKGSCFTKM